MPSTILAPLAPCRPARPTESANPATGAVAASAVAFSRLLILFLSGMMAWGAVAVAAESAHADPSVWLAYAPPAAPVRETFLLPPPTHTPAASDNLANRPSLSAPVPVAVARANSASSAVSTSASAYDRLAPMVRPEGADGLALARGPASAVGTTFSHALPPEAAPAGVPKTLRDLRAQLGGGFAYAQQNGFLVASDLPPAAFDSLVDGILSYARQALIRDYFPAAASAAPVTVYVFRDAASYEANLSRHFRMAPVSPYGHYAHRQRYLVVNGDTGPGTLVHEMTHALMAVDFPEAPIWLSEGIASLYEQCRVDVSSGRLMGESNWRLPELRAALDQNRMPTLARLLALETRGFRTGAESLNYAHARYFCLYLESRGLLRDVYRVFRDNHERDRTGRRFVEAATGQSLADLDRDFCRWLATCRWDG